MATRVGELLLGRVATVATVATLMPYYAVRKGRHVGISLSWQHCQDNVKGFPGAEFKKFATLDEATKYLRANASEPKSLASTPAEHSSRKRTYDKIESSMTHEDEARCVYIDGSALGNGTSRARAGYGVYWGPDHPKYNSNVSARLPGVAQTNQRAELQAAITALQQASSLGIGPLEIRTDSHYTINAVTKWIPQWKKRSRHGEWTTTLNKSPDNEDLLRVLNQLFSEYPSSVRWTYVEAHRGEPGNEAADKLAKLGATKATENSGP